MSSGSRLAELFFTLSIFYTMLSLANSSFGVNFELGKGRGESLFLCFKIISGISLLKTLKFVFSYLLWISPDLNLLFPISDHLLNESFFYASTEAK